MYLNSIYRLMIVFYNDYIDEISLRQFRILDWDWYNKLKYSKKLS